MKLEDLERDLKMAYLNYENDDLKETLKYLDRMLKEILDEDKSLEIDPFWKIVTCDVFKAIVLNNFYNKKELTINDIDSLLTDQEMVNKNIKEFCNNFRDNDMINIVSHIENITESILKEVSRILITNIGKMNIPSVRTLENSDISTTENKAEKITQYDIIEVLDKKTGKIKTYDIKTNIENVVSKMGISYLQNGKEIYEETIIFTFKIVNIGENFIIIKTNPMCEVKDGKINLNRAENIFSLTKNGKLCLSTPTMDRGYNFELSIKQRNLNDNGTTHVNEQLIEELSNYIKNNSAINIMEDWYSCKNSNPQFKEFFDATEKEAIQEIVGAQNNATILKHIYLFQIHTEK